MMDESSDEDQEAQRQDVHQVFTPKGEEGHYQGNHILNHAIRPNLK
jgi:hypothetical protein